MFVGHYGPGFAAKALKKSIPLWLLFLGVQLVDIFWAIFVLMGIEKLRIVPGITATNPLDLYYMPYTHSLVAAILWSGAAMIAYRLIKGPGDWSAASILGAAVFSHWILDFLVHRPDLPLYGNNCKMGLGLWNFPVVAMAAEVILLGGGIYLYYRTTESVHPWGRYGMVVLGIVMVAFQVLAFFGPPPPSARTATVTSLFAYFAFAGLAFWLERKRNS